jgi:hypothetical protein
MGDPVKKPEMPLFRNRCISGFEDFSSMPNLSLKLNISWDKSSFFSNNSGYIVPFSFRNYSRGGRK